MDLFLVTPEQRPKLSSNDQHLSSIVLFKWLFYTTRLFGLSGFSLIKHGNNEYVEPSVKWKVYSLLMMGINTAIIPLILKGLSATKSYASFVGIMSSVTKSLSAVVCQGVCLYHGKPLIAFINTLSIETIPQEKVRRISLLCKVVSFPAVFWITWICYTGITFSLHRSQDSIFFDSMFIFSSVYKSLGIIIPFLCDLRFAAYVLILTEQLYALSSEITFSVGKSKLLMSKYEPYSKRYLDIFGRADVLNNIFAYPLVLSILDGFLEILTNTFILIRIGFKSWDLAFNLACNFSVILTRMVIVLAVCDKAAKAVSMVDIIGTYH